MPLRVAILLLSANFFATAYVAFPTGHPGLLGMHADGPGQRRLGKADNGNEERITFAQVVDLQAEATTELIVNVSQYLKRALDHAHHYWARWNLSRQSKRIFERFMEAEGKNNVDTMMTSFTEKAILSTIHALRRVDDPDLQAIAERMQSKQFQLWKARGIEADDLFGSLKLEKILSERLKDPKFVSLADSPEFTIWAAYVNDSWDTKSTKQPQLKKTFGAIKGLFKGYKGKAVSVLSLPINNSRTLQLNLRKLKVSLIVKKIKGKKSKRNK
uniref:Uncharacterized protein n=1 Tax=Peronospora matthiolae TaxID=2874970 RepID=A0AAV1VDJ1_9STRA